MSLTMVTVHGVYVRQDDATPATGTVTFTLAQAIKNTADDVVIVPYDTVCALDSSGHFSTVLPALDDPATTPTGVTYMVQERVEGSNRSFSLALSRLSTDVDMAVVSPGVPGDLSFVVLASDVQVDPAGMSFVTVTQAQGALGQLDAAVEARYFIVPYSSGWPTRPPVPAVHWVGPVDPASLAVDGDLWTNTS